MLNIELSDLLTACKQKKTVLKRMTNKSKQKTVLMVNWIVWNEVKPFNSEQKKGHACLIMLLEIIFSICIKKIWH